MIAYHLDYQLNADELVEVEIAVGEPVDLVRIPWLARLGDTRPATAGQFLPHLERARIRAQATHTAFPAAAWPCPASPRLRRPAVR